MFITWQQIVKVIKAALPVLQMARSLQHFMKNAFERVECGLVGVSGRKETTFGKNPTKPLPCNVGDAVRTGPSQSSHADCCLSLHTRQVPVGTRQVRRKLFVCVLAGWGSLKVQEATTEASASWLQDVLLVPQSGISVHRVGWAESEDFSLLFKAG